jgi:D-alanyl-lipoteichoic acid acyltransferase DltB (MBOAT superfamily)
MLADTFRDFVGPIYEAHFLPSFPDAWGATLAFALQVYFDFSGYSDMAIGLARMFGVRFPENFDSPYQCTNMVEYWRRWHITLSFFLRDYVYIPLGGNRKGELRQHLNLFLTMLAGGLWHGASWTFVVWGGLQGVALSVNHAWRTHTRWLRHLWRGLEHRARDGGGQWFCLASPVRLVYAGEISRNRGGLVGGVVLSQPSDHHAMGLGW